MEQESDLTGALKALAEALSVSEESAAALSDLPGVMMQAAEMLRIQGEKIDDMREQLSALNQGFSNEQIIGIYDSMKLGSAVQPREEVLAFARALFSAQASNKV